MPSKSNKLSQTSKASVLLMYSCVGKESGYVGFSSEHIAAVPEANAEVFLQLLSKGKLPGLGDGHWRRGKSIQPVVLGECSRLKDP